MLRVATYGLLFLLPITLHAAEKKPATARAGSEAKTVSGMSIVGNNETPKSLYIVPWKSSEIGGDTNLAANALNDSMKPVDRDVFMRELNFYELGKAN